MRHVLAVAALLAGTPAQARANATASGFSLTYEASVPVQPAIAWSAVVAPSRWWDGRHTYSGRAANLSLDARAGGSWCERLGEGASVEHGHVLLAYPTHGLLRLSAPLGPLQADPWPRSWPGN